MGRPSPVLSGLSDSGSLCDSTSLGLLNPGNFKRHGQRSATTFLTDIARSVDVDHSNPNTTSQTNVDHLPHSPTNEKKGSCVEEDKKGVEKKSKKGRKGPEIDDIEGDDDQTTHQTELDQDAAIDPAPFRFKPYELAHMLDPKSIEILEAFGGIDGLCGLGTNADTGLVTNTQHIHSLKSSHKPSPEAGESASKRHGLPNTGAGENSDDGEQAEVPTTTDYKLDPSVVRSKTTIRKQKSKSMIQGKEITISGGKLTNVEGNYHEHNTARIYVYNLTFSGLEALRNGFNHNLFNFPTKENNTKSIDSGRQTMHSPSRVENENIGDTTSSNYATEIHFNSLNDPPPTPVFDDGYCIYQTPTPSRINDFTPNSRTSSAIDQEGCNLSSGNQYPYPFGYLPVLVPGIVHYSPCWLPSWCGWIASWISWISPPTWIWPSFV